jgi:hypothetical protein
VNEELVAATVALDEVRRLAPGSVFLALTFFQIADEHYFFGFTFSFSQK